MAHLRRYSALLIIALCGCVSASANKVAAPENAIGKIDLIRGVVMLTRFRAQLRQDIQATVGMELFEKDEISTAAQGQALLRLNGGNTIMLAPNSFYRVTHHRHHEATGQTQSLTKILYGKVRAKITSIKDNPQSSVQFHLPNAVLGVRGTDFFVGFDPKSQGSTVVANEGSVSFQAAHFNNPSSSTPTVASKEFVVSAGEELTVTGMGTAKAPPSVTPIRKVDMDQLTKMQEEFGEGAKNAKVVDQTATPQNKASDKPQAPHTKFIELSTRTMPLFKDAKLPVNIPLLTSEHTMSHSLNKLQISFRYGGQGNRSSFGVGLGYTQFVLNKEAASVIEGYRAMKGPTVAWINYFDIFDGFHFLSEPQFMYLFISPETSGSDLMGIVYSIKGGYEFVFSFGLGIGLRGVASLYSLYQKEPSLPQTSSSPFSSLESLDLSKKVHFGFGFGFEVVTSWSF